MIDQKELRKIITKGSKITSAKFSSALKKAKKNKELIEDILIEDQMIDKKGLGELIAKEFDVPFADLNRNTIKKQVLTIIPEVTARKQFIIAFDKTLDGLKVAFNDPSDIQLQHFLEKKSGEKIIPYYALKTDIKNAFKLYKDKDQKDFSSIIVNYLDKAKQGGEKKLPIIKIVEAILNYAYDNRTSDIHIEPYEKETIIRFRIDGILHDVLSLPRKYHSEIVSRLKIMSKLRTDEHMSAQDGKLQIVLADETLDVRVSILPVIGGEKVVMRLLSKKLRAFNLENLGFNEQDLKKVQKAIKRPWGMILATGATGSGKTTTMYAVLKKLNKSSVNVQTIEDPVEYDIERVNQIQVNRASNLTFAKGLRSILRQDPDIIMVGEIRDDETAQIGVNAAMTGHLVLSTLHTNDAATTLPRLLDMNVKPYLIASTVIIAIGQRLVRKLCPDCTKEYTLSAAEFKKIVPENIAKKYIKNKKSIKLFKGDGCNSCFGTGYSGRIGIYEILEVTPEIRRLIINKATSQQIEIKAVEQGMTTMVEDGLIKVMNGLTSIDEVLRVI